MEIKSICITPKIGHSYRFWEIFLWGIKKRAYPKEFVSAINTLFYKFLWTNSEEITLKTNYFTKNSCIFANKTTMTFNSELLEKLVCPNCGNELRYDESTYSLVCSVFGCTYAIKKNVPIMISEKEGESPKDPHSFDYLDHYKKDAEQFDYFEEQSGATKHSEKRLREYILSQIPATVTSILDVGSGSAWVAKQFRNSNIFLCSLDATIINTSKALEKYPSAKHAAVVADAFALPFKPASFDCVIAAEIIEHVPDPKVFLNSLLKVIKPGGTLIISTPYKEVIKYALCIHCNQRTPLNSHLHSFDENKLRLLVADVTINTFDWRAFNNKLLLFARTYVFLRYLPFPMWKFIDRLANLIYNKPVNIVLQITV